jgi:hypothetical protein
MLEDRGRNGRITLKWIIGSYGARRGGGWNWLRVVYDSTVIVVLFSYNSPQKRLNVLID